MTASETHKQAWGITGTNLGPAAPAAKPAARTKAKPAAKPEKGPEDGRISPGKTTRITVDLDQAAYTALNRWLASAAIEVSPDARRVSLASAVRAMIDVTTRDRDIAVVVIDWLRRQNT